MLCLRDFKKDILFAWWSHLIIASVFTFFFTDILYCTISISIYLYTQSNDAICHFQAWHVQLDHEQSEFFAVCAVVQCRFELDFFLLSSWFYFYVCLFFTFHVSRKQMSYKLKPLVSCLSCSTLFFLRGCHNSDINFYFICISLQWKVSALTTRVTCQKVISTVLLHWSW